MLSHGRKQQFLIDSVPLHSCEGKIIARPLQTAASVEGAFLGYFARLDGPGWGRRALPPPPSRTPGNAARSLSLASVAREANASKRAFYLFALKTGMTIRVSRSRPCLECLPGVSYDYSEDQLAS
jgi:hypothetical protein